MQPSAVVLTMSDYGGPSLKDLELRSSFVGSVFWPVSDDEVERGPVLVCSAKLSGFMQGLEKFLGGFDEKPEWELFWDPVREEVCCCL